MDENRRSRTRRGTRAAPVALGETVRPEAYEIIPPPFTATTMDAVDFVLAHGMEAFGRGDDAAPTPASVEDLRALRARGGARKIPLCVANPDVETVSGSELIAMPGALAMWYAETFAEAHPGEDANGHVCEMGKPDAVAYDALLGEFGVDAGGKIVAVGDSLAHDIAGANARVSTPSSCAARGYTSTTFDARRRARTRTRRCGDCTPRARDADDVVENCGGDET